MKVRFARLHLHLVEVDGTRVDAYRCARLHPPAAYAVLFDGLGQKRGGRLGAPAAFHLPPADVHETVEKRAGRHDHGPGAERGAPYGAQASDGAVFHDEFGRFVLPYTQVLRVLQALAPGRDEPGPVALCPRAPHSRSFRAVEHTELDGRCVGHLARQSAQGVYFADDLPLRDAAYGRVAAHLGYLVHVHRYQTCPCAHPGCRRGRFAAGVAGTYHHHIKVKDCFHVRKKVFRIADANLRHSPYSSAL